jgi:hypothetical protein
MHRLKTGTCDALLDIEERPMKTQLRRWQSYVLPCALVVATAALGGTASAQFGWRGGVRLYTGANFRGQSVTVREDTPSLVPLGINDRVESIQIPNGEAWEVCVDVDYGNQCQLLEGSVADLGAMGWGGRISSLRRVSGGGYASNRRYGGAVGTSGVVGGAVVFADPNFNGQAMTLRGAVPNLVPSGFNDKISSIQIPDGESWEVCQDVDYGGTCQVVTGSISDLRGMGWNDRISSLRPVGSNGNYGYRNNGNVYNGGYNNGSVYNNGSQGLVFFGRTGFRGASRVVSGGSTNVGWAARSIQVRDNRPWQVCDYNGECATITGDVPDVSQLGLNGRITSVRPLNNTSRWRR